MMVLTIALLTVLLGLTGMRNHEVCSIFTDTREDDVEICGIPRET